jgi:hypothetical protein
MPHLPSSRYSLTVLMALTLVGCGSVPSGPAIRAARSTAVQTYMPTTVVAQGHEQPVKRSAGVAYQQIPSPGTASRAVGLTARIVEARNGLVLGLGSYRTTIVVENAALERRTGMLVVTFTRGGKPVPGEPYRQPITLDAGELDTIHVSDARWATNGAVAAIEAFEASAAAML